MDKRAVVINDIKKLLKHLAKIAKGSSDALSLQDSIIDVTGCISVLNKAHKLSGNSIYSVYSESVDDTIDKLHKAADTMNIGYIRIKVCQLVREELGRLD